MSDRREEKKDFLDFEIQFYEDLVRDKPDFVDALRPLADAYTKRGLVTKGLEIDQRLARLCPEDETVFYNLACSHSLIGNYNDALEALNRAIALGYSDLEHLLHDRDLKALHKNPQFLQMVRSLRGAPGDD